MPNQDQVILTAILNTAIDSIIVIDGCGEIRLANPATSQLFGYEQDEMVGNNVSMLMPTPYHEEHDGYINGYQKTGNAKIIGIGREVVGRRKDGSTFPAHLAVSELLLGDKRLFAGIIRDISDLKRVQDELDDANRMLSLRVEQRTAELRVAQDELVKSARQATLGQISGGIAHEIRNPLNAVRTSVYFLRNAKNASPEKVNEHLERIDRQVSLVDNVVGSLSDIARLPEPNAEDCDLIELIRSVANSMSMPENFRFDWNSDVPVIAHADPNQIAIVIRNLLRNARDAMPDGGVISIEGRIEDGFATVDVSDSGIGIEEESIGRILEPFYSTKSRGMGLGLAISVSILHKNSGKISVVSQVGQGTKFTFSLPISRETKEE